MKKGIKRVWAEIVAGAGGIVFVTRHPRSDRAAWMWITIWSVCLVLACGSVTLYVLQRDYGEFFLYLNTAVLVLDVYMLRHALAGLRYRRARRGKTGRRSLP